MKQEGLTLRLADAGVAEELTSFPNPHPAEVPKIVIMESSLIMLSFLDRSGAIDRRVTSKSSLRRLYVPTKLEKRELSALGNDMGAQQSVAVQRELKQLKEIALLDRDTVTKMIIDLNEAGLDLKGREVRRVDMLGSY